MCTVTPASGVLREIMHCVESRPRTNALGRLNQGVIGWLTQQHINGTPIKSHLLTSMTMTMVVRRYINTPSVLHRRTAPYEVATRIILLSVVFAILCSRLTKGRRWRGSRQINTLNGDNLLSTLQWNRRRTMRAPQKNVCTIKSTCQVPLSRWHLHRLEWVLFYVRCQPPMFFEWSSIRSSLMFFWYCSTCAAKGTSHAWVLTAAIATLYVNTPRKQP